MIFALLTAAAWAGTVDDPGADPNVAWRSRRVALVVGVQDYTDPRLQGLRFARADATDLAETLQAPGLGGFDEVRVLTSADTTTRAALEANLAELTADLSRDDTFLVYLSGHGTLTWDPAAGSRLWFLPSDARLEEAEATGWSLADLEARIHQLPPRRRVLILDTCHNARLPESGLIGRSQLSPGTEFALASLRGEAPPPGPVREVSESEARLYAAELHQAAMEDPALGHGVYTHYLLQALRDDRSQADLDGDGLVDVAEAHDWARDHTLSHTGGAQVPRAEYRIVGREEIWLSGEPERRSAAESALLSTTDALLKGARLLVDGVPRGVGPGLVPIEPGLHELRLETESGQRLAGGKVQLSAGETYSVERLFTRDQSASARFEMAMGASMRGGPGAAHFPFAAPELEVLRRANLGNSQLFWSDIHVRGTASRGWIPEQTWGPVNAGDAAAGAAVLLATGPVLVGPMMDVGLAWRVFENENGENRQAAPTLNPGARVALSRSRWSLRYDLRSAHFVHDDAATHMWQHGLAFGLRPPL